MNRIETKIIIMVTNRLAAAKDSDAKTEMIEELSENLYQRYLELMGGGVPEEEALRQAMESLGDVEELLSFLKETELEAQAAQPGCGKEEAAQEAAPKAAAQECESRAVPQECESKAVPQEGESKAAPQEGESKAAQQEGEPTGAAAEAAPEEEAAQEKETENEESAGSFFRDDLESGIEEIVNAAISTARVAVDCARDVARDVSDQIKEKYPDGVFTQFSGQKDRNTERMVFPAEKVESLDIRFTNGDISFGSTEEPDIFIEIEGDTQEVETALREDGRLSVTQGNTASAVFLFMRGIRRTNVEIRLPEKVWNSIAISTASGDIAIRDGMACRELKITSSSGDLELEKVSCENMELKLSSGDIAGDALRGNLLAETKSGDIRISGLLGRCELFSTSGDVQFTGECQAMNCSSTSGDVKLVMERLCETIKGKSISGDCEIFVPAGEGFHLSYRTVSGSFSTDVALSGRMEKKCGDVVSGETVNGDISLSSVSGDIRISELE